MKQQRTLWPALALAGLFSCLSQPAAAQCSGQPSGNTICASPADGSAGLPNFRKVVTGDIAVSAPNNAILFNSGGTMSGSSNLI